ncbi:MAG: methyltransferase domain-containing protein [Hydrococcus sp. SU_1_0]|nr:methyltransferase domain-containing protein [Hydrococcus sp. SU_1_0]
MDTIENKNYPDLDASLLDENSSLTKMLGLIGNNKRVVDFGCATGYFAHLLAQQQCVVTGVEINPEAAKAAEKYCQEVIVADLDFVAVQEILAEGEFDVAIFGDVLEHLRNPWKVLQDTKQILKEDGYVVASIPNIAHGAIRLALLQGRFEYTELGILDNTHLRFFTRKTVEDLLENSGYLLKDLESTKLPFLANNNLVPQININDFDGEMIKKMQQDEDIDTLQFVMKAVPSTVEARLTNLQNRYSKLLQESETTRFELDQSHRTIDQLQSELQQSRQASNQLQSQLQESRQTSNQLQSQLNKLEQANTTIQWMETSKFWKLRTKWLKLKLLFQPNH